MGKDITESPVSAAHLGELVDLIADNTISGKIAKTVFADMLSTGKAPKAIVQEKGLVQVTDTGAITAAIDKIIASSPENVAAFKGGNEKVFGWFVGQVMKETGGKANPKILNDLLRQKLSA
jgi:aspartyl-tRNA(Asn)/glutamyl-tRNA(Gln) amidotransferase subunit B